jgi:hypothetical protein
MRAASAIGWSASVRAQRRAAMKAFFLSWSFRFCFISFFA